MNRISLIVKQKIISIILLIAAVLGGIVIFWYVSDLKEKIPDNIDYNPIFVARIDIRKGEEIKGESIEEQKITGNVFSEKFIMDKDKIIGKKVINDILKGEIITEDILEGMDSGSGFSLDFSSYIPYDLRAVSIPVSFYGDRSLLEEGDYIDLISVYYDEGSSSLYSKTVLSEKEIILLGSNPGNSNSGNENDMGNFLMDPVITDSRIGSDYENPLIITFYLSREETEEVFLALERGVINISVCSGDNF
ncbi:MAG: SAF domain-containing protein [Actinomycetota bacterium]|nr:SAF domain-containing protein [Actinomycetota bacterium]